MMIMERFLQLQDDDYSFRTFQKPLLHKWKKHCISFTKCFWKILIRVYVEILFHLPPQNFVVTSLCFRGVTCCYDSYGFISFNFSRSVFLSSGYRTCHYGTCTSKMDQSNWRLKFNVIAWLHIFDWSWSYLLPSIPGGLFGRLRKTPTVQTEDVKSSTHTYGSVLF
jgi:hypothetical protein